MLAAYENDDDQPAAVRAAIDLDGPADVAIVGSSMMHQGVVVADIEKALPNTRVRNYAIRGGQVDLFDATVQYLLRQPTKPRVILVGIALRDLRQREEDAAADRMANFWSIADLPREYRIQPSGKMAAAAPVVVRANLGRAWAALRYRTGLAIWIKSRFVETDVEPSPARGDLPSRLAGSRGQTSLDEPDVLAPYLKSKTNLAQRMMQTYRLDLPAEPAKRLQDRVQHMIDACRSANVTLIFVDLPIAEPLKRLIDTAQKAKKGRDASNTFDPEYRRVMQRLTQATGTPFLTAQDLGVTFTNADFFDGQHLNLSGAKKLSAALGQKTLKSE